MSYTLIAYRADTDTGTSYSDGDHVYSDFIMEHNISLEELKDKLYNIYLIGLKDTYEEYDVIHILKNGKLLVRYEYDDKSWYDDCMEVYDEDNICKTQYNKALKTIREKQAKEEAKKKLLEEKQKAEQEVKEMAEYARLKEKYGNV